MSIQRQSKLPAFMLNACRRRAFLTSIQSHRWAVRKIQTHMYSPHAEAKRSPRSDLFSKSSGFRIGNDCLLQERESKAQLTASSGKYQQASLLWTIARILGWPYLSLGLIKLVNDILNFAGRACLHPFVSKILSRKYICQPHLLILQRRVIQVSSYGFVKML